MKRVLAISDDFTGALDTGVQFVKRGISTKVMTTADARLLKSAGDCQVLVVNAETRHMSRQQADQTISRIVRAASPYFSIIYKKTDSALRGNIGSELTAQLMASGEDTLFFVPAFPAMSRLTKGGVHYIDGQPVAKSVFGEDPFEPVKYSYIPEIIGEQSDVRVKCVTKNSDFAGEAQNGKTIFVFDAQSDEDIREIAGLIRRKNVRMVAGCAGLAQYIAINREKRPPRPVPAIGKKGLVVISGSMNPITIKQIVRAMYRGIPCFNLTNKLKMTPGYAQTKEFDAFAIRVGKQVENCGAAIIGSVNRGENAKTLHLFEMRANHYKRTAMEISANIGGLFKGLVDRGIGGAYLLIGGDTLIACMNALGCGGLTPLREIATGAVLARADYPGGKLYIITKSGGLGEEDIIGKTIQFLNREIRREERDEC